MKELSERRLGGFERAQVDIWDSAFHASLVLHLLAELSACSAPAPERHRSRSSRAREYWLRLLTFPASSSQTKACAAVEAHTPSPLALLLELGSVFLWAIWKLASELFLKTVTSCRIRLSSTSHPSQWKRGEQHQCLRTIGSPRTPPPKSTPKYWVPSREVNGFFFFYSLRYDSSGGWTHDLRVSFLLIASFYFISLWTSPRSQLLLTHLCSCSGHCSEKRGRSTFFLFFLDRFIETIFRLSALSIGMFQEGKKKDQYPLLDVAI